MEAQSIQQQIIDVNDKIKKSTEAVLGWEQKVESQTKVWENATVDNNEKKIAVDAFEAFKQFDPKHITSVAITNDDVQKVMGVMQTFIDKLNSVKVFADEQKQTLDTYQAELKKNRDELQEHKDLKLSYQIQLRVAMKKKEEELAAMRKLLEDDQPEQGAAEAVNPNGGNKQ